MKLERALEIASRARLHPSPPADPTVTPKVDQIDRRGKDVTVTRDSRGRFMVGHQMAGPGRPVGSRGRLSAAFRRLGCRMGAIWSRGDQAIGSGAPIELRAAHGPHRADLATQIEIGRLMDTAPINWMRRWLTVARITDDPTGDLIDDLGRDPDIPT